MFGAITRDGLQTFAITCAMVNVLPDPVTPKRTWCFFPAKILLHKASIAFDWSPFGVKSETNLKEDIRLGMICS